MLFTSNKKVGVSCFGVLKVNAECAAGSLLSQVCVLGDCSYWQSSICFGLGGHMTGAEQDSQYRLLC